MGLDIAWWRELVGDVQGAQLVSPPYEGDMAQGGILEAFTVDGAFLALASFRGGHALIAMKMGVGKEMGIDIACTCVWL